MPKSMRQRIIHLSEVSTKRMRKDKDRRLAAIRQTVPKYQHCFVFSLTNIRNSYIRELRRELNDCQLIFGKNKLMIKAFGDTPADAFAPGLDGLAQHIAGGVGLLFTNRQPADVIDYFARLAKVDFARAGAIASRDFTIPPGVVYSTAGEVPVDDDVLLEGTIEPELRKLGVPTRLIKGKIVLGEESGQGEGYPVCKKGDKLDSRQTRLLRIFSLCLSEFRVKLLASVIYTSPSTGPVCVR